VTSPSDALKPLLAQLASGRPLAADQAQAAFEIIMTGQAAASQIGALLGMIQLRGPSVEEIIGAARVMRAKVTAVAAPPGWTLIDTCGTGGDHGGTFNISTAAALVAAGAGRPRRVAVAKHGNRGITSQSGSSQVLETLGVKLAVAPDRLTQCLQEAGICFCFAPAHHPAMKHAAAVRQELGFRTLFNMLGPLTNPAGVQRQVMGVFDAALTEPIARALASLGAVRALVVHGSGLDELTTCGPSRVSEVRDGRVNSYDFDAASLGLPRATVQALQVADPARSAAVVRQVLQGQPGPARDIVALNAAAAIVVAGLADDLPGGLALARQTLDSGAAMQALDNLVRITNA
jgi:anthranilate phosphoribosyltransferase